MDHPLGFAVRWALFTSMLLSVFLPIILCAFVLSGKQWRAAQDRARARRLAEYRMNARLLRLNIRRVPNGLLNVSQGQVVRP